LSQGNSDTSNSSSAQDAAAAAAEDDQVDSYNLVIGFSEKPSSEPSVMEMNGLMCEAKSYVTQRLQNGLKDPSIEVSIHDIAWSFTADCETPIILNFTIDASGGDRSPVSSSDIFHLLELGDDELVDFVQNYVWKSQPQGSPFEKVDKLQFEETIEKAGELATQAQIPEAICPEQKAPPASPAGSPAAPSRASTFTLSVR